jgi:hypothetical protein
MGFRMSEVTLPPPSPSSSPSHAPNPLHIKNCPKGFCFFADRKRKGQDKEKKETAIRQEKGKHEIGEIGKKEMKGSAQNRRQATQHKKK